MHQHTIKVAFWKKRWALYAELPKEEPTQQSLKYVTAKVKSFQERKWKKHFAWRIFKEKENTLRLRIFSLWRRCQWHLKKLKWSLEANYELQIRRSYSQGKWPLRTCYRNLTVIIERTWLEGGLGKDTEENYLLTKTHSLLGVFLCLFCPTWTLCVWQPICRHSKLSYNLK